jgi:hypothetical protein
MLIAKIGTEKAYWSGSDGKEDGPQGRVDKRGGGDVGGGGGWDKSHSRA